ncbi:MAG TPA: hypothetical protein VIL61_04715 [Nitrospiria bacterium]
MTGSWPASRIPRTVTGIALASMLLVAVAAAEEPPASPPAVEPLPDLSADLQITAIDRNGHTSATTVHIYRSGKLIRYEHRQADPPEVFIMDFGRLKEYRIYAGDKIYFETSFSSRLARKAQREGLIRMEENPDILQSRIVLREDTIDGHPCDIVLLIRTVKNRKELGSDYTLLWEARDLKRQPLRIAYHQNNYMLMIVDLRDVKFEPVDAALLQPPPGFVSMNPY